MAQAQHREAWAARRRWRTSRIPPDASWIATHFTLISKFEARHHLQLLHDALRAFPLLSLKFIFPLTDSWKSVPTNQLQRWALLSLTRTTLKHIPSGFVLHADVLRLQRCITDALVHPGVLLDDLSTPIVAQLLLRMAPGLAAEIAAHLVHTHCITLATPRASAWHYSREEDMRGKMSASMLVPSLPTLVGECERLDAWLSANRARVTAANVVHLAAGNDDWLMRTCSNLMRLSLSLIQSQTQTQPQQTLAWLIADTHEGSVVCGASLLSALVAVHGSASNTATLLTDLVLECDTHAMAFVLLYARCCSAPQCSASPATRHQAHAVLRHVHNALKKAQRAALIPFDATPLLRALIKATQW